MTTSKTTVTVYDSNGNEVTRFEFDMQVGSSSMSFDTSNWIPANKHPCINQTDISGLLLSMARKAEQRRMLARMTGFGLN